MLAIIEILNLLSKVFFFLGYLTSETYPEKLTPAQEKEYIRLMAQGDEEAKNKLILHNMRLVAHVVKKYSTCPIDTEDLLSIGTVGLIKGINTFDPDKASRLAGYVAKCIDNEILMAIRNESKRSGSVSLEDVIGCDDEGNNIMLIESKLDLRERTIIKLRYGLNNIGKKYTQMEVAEMMDISRSYVSRLEKKAIQTLSEYFDMKKY